METIGEAELWTFMDGSRQARPAINTAIRKGAGHKVASYLELASKVAELQFRNRAHVLLFRGQQKDYLNRQRNSSLKPSLFRPDARGQNPAPGVLERRFRVLARAEELLLERFIGAKFLGRERLQRYRILRWAILQHYEVCPTPLLDVSQSLRIAASFASQAGKPAYLYVLGVPHIGGAVSASAEANLQTIRLASVCPPTALRPHIQEGYLLGEYPEMADYSQKRNYAHFEIDFARRLIAKFRFEPAKFWSTPAFPMVPSQALYPDAHDDPLQALMQQIRTQLDRHSRASGCKAVVDAGMSPRG